MSSRESRAAGATPNSNPDHEATRPMRVRQSTCSIYGVVPTGITVKDQLATRLYVRTLQTSNHSSDQASRGRTTGRFRREVAGPIRQRPAPRAMRTVISLDRPIALASMRFARLARAISSTNATAAHMDA